MATKLRSEAAESTSSRRMEFPQDDYPIWLTKERVMGCIYSLPTDPWWNSLVCIYILTHITYATCVPLDPPLPYRSANLNDYTDILLKDIPYIFHVATLICSDFHCIRSGESRSLYQFGYILDAFTVSAPLIITAVMGISTKSWLIVLAVTSLQMHRPFRYLWSLNYYLKASLLGILFKYFYISVSMRIFYAFIFYYYGITEDLKYDDAMGPFHDKKVRLMFRAFYEINKIFIPIGPERGPKNRRDRIFYIMTMISGVLLVLGIAIASLSLIISLYMRPEEEFRSRFRLIMDDMKQNNVPSQLRKKVETFYQMFWHKQKAVSETRLLPIYPRCLVGDIRTNIYFEAMQKSRVIRDLPSPFLAEIANRMETVHYIPGDFIIKRNSNKYFMFFIKYGDIELLSAEDDETALLRFTRGTILNPCGPCPEVACTRSYVAISAATFCTAHALKAQDLWLLATKYGLNGESSIIRAAFSSHMNNVKMHFQKRSRPPFKYNSNIILLKRTLMELKEARDENGKLLLERADMFINIAGCYVMRNHADMTLTEESDEICLRQTFPCILQPESSLLFTWNFFVAVVTVSVIFVHPYYLVYLKDVPLGFRFFNYMVTFIFILDIIVHLSTGTKVEEGVPLTFTQTSSEQMKSCWFIINLISVLPIFELIKDGYYAGINKITRLPQIFRTLKYLEDVCVYHSNVLRFFSFFLFSVIMTYLGGALQQHFGCSTYGYCLVKNFTSPYWVKEPLDNGPVDGRLTYSLYYAISMITFTTHKTAKVAKSLWQYQLFVLILLEVCCVVHILIEGTYSATIMVTENMRDRYNTTINTVKNFLVKINMDPVLRHRFINYLQLCWYTDKAYSITHRKNSILFDLPSHVNEDILTMQRSKYFLSIPFMKFLTNDVLKKISAKARLFYTAPGEILLNTGDISNEIYVIKEGVCEVLDPKTKAVVRLLSAKGYFGDIECLLRLPAYYTVRAATHVHLFTIFRKDLEACISTPKIKDAIHYAKELPEYGVLMNAQVAFITYQLPPRTPNRQYFPLKRKHESDFEFLHPFYKFGHLSIFRYVFPRFTFRPDGRYLKRYECFRAACALASAIIYPTYTFMELQWPILWKLTWLLDLTAYYDILHRTLVGYFDQNGILIYHPASTFTHYLKGAFLVDLLGCLPLEALDYVRTTIYFKDNAYRIPATYSSLMYNRLLQLYRVPHTVDILGEYIDRQDIILIIKAVPVFLALICIVTSLILDISVTKWRKVNGGWRLEIRNDSIFGNWIDNYVKSETTSALKYNITETPWNVVLTTFYWVVYETTSTGFNLFQPSQLHIMFVLITGMLLGTVITIYYAVRVISIRANVNQALGKYQEHMKDIRIFMKKEKLSKELQRSVISHYEYHWERMGGSSYYSTLELCDQITLRTDAILHIYGETFFRCPIIPKDIPFLRNVGRAVTSVYMREKMSIVEWDDVICSMYVVDRGFVRMLDRKNVVTYLPRGSVFGNLDSQTVVCPTKFVSGSKVHLLKINADEFHDIIQDFPSVKALIDTLRPNNENYIATDLMSDKELHSKMSCVEMQREIAVTEKVMRFFYEHPKLVQIYTTIIANLSLYGDIYNAGFQDNRILLVPFLYVLDVCYIITILLKLAQPYMADKGTDTKKELVTINNKYRKSLFKYEGLSCVPFEILCIFSKHPFSLFAFFRLNRCLRLVSISDNMTRYHKNVNINLTLTTVVSVTMWLMLFVHTAACIWFHLSLIEDKHKPGSSWKHLLYTHFGNQDKSISKNYYFYSVYFIITTFTQNGVGDILPQQQSEVVFVCVLMILSTIIFMIFVGEYSNIIQYQSFRYYAFYSKYLELLAFLKNNKVADNLITVTKKYTLHLWQESRGRQSPYFLKSAPQCLRLDIMSAAYMHHLSSHPVFGKCEPPFLRQLVGHLDLFHYSEDLHVVKECEITNSMYFVHKGSVQEISENLLDKRAIFKAGQHFGTVNGVNRDIPYEINYKTIIKSQVLTLCFDEWEYLLQHFPLSKSIIDDYNSSSDDVTKSNKKIQIDRKLSRTSIKQEHKYDWPTDSRKSHVEILNEDKRSVKFKRMSKVPENIPLSQFPIDIKRSTAAGSTDPEEKKDTTLTATVNETTIEIRPELDKNKEQDVNQINKRQVTYTGITKRDTSPTTDEFSQKPTKLHSVSESKIPTKAENSVTNLLLSGTRESPSAGPIISDKNGENVSQIKTEGKHHILFSGNDLINTPQSRQVDNTEFTELNNLISTPSNPASPKIDEPTVSGHSQSSKSKEAGPAIQEIKLADNTLTTKRTEMPSKIMPEIRGATVLRENKSNEIPLEKNTSILPNINKEYKSTTVVDKDAKTDTDIKIAKIPENLILQKTKQPLLNEKSIKKPTLQNISELPENETEMEIGNQSLSGKSSEKSKLNMSTKSSKVSLELTTVSMDSEQFKSEESEASMEKSESLASTSPSVAQFEKKKQPETLSPVVPERDSYSVEDYIMTKKQKKRKVKKPSDSTDSESLAGTSSASSTKDKNKKTK